MVTKLSRRSLPPPPHHLISMNPCNLIDASHFLHQGKYLHCPTCHHASETIFQHPDISWCGVLSCIQCHPNEKWFLCQFCDAYPAKSKHILTARNLGKHFHTLMHKKATSTLHLRLADHNSGSVNAQTFLPDDASVELSTNSLESISTIPQWLLSLQQHGQDPVNFASLFPTIMESAPRRNKLLQNAIYFESQHKMKSGPMAIVGKALYGSSDSMTAQSISPSNCLFEVLLAMLTSNLSQAQNEMLGALLQHVRDFPTKLGCVLPNGRIDLPLKVPLHGKQIRALYVEGPNSIMELVPRPSIQVLPDGHAYISIRESIRHLLAHGVTMEPLLSLKKDDSSIGPICHGSSARREQLMEPVDVDYIFPLKAIVWSDGFLASNIVQTSDSSVHTCMLSIGTPEGDHSGGNTCLVWLGPSSGDHEAVEKRLCEELQELTDLDRPDNIFYHGGIKKNIRLYLALYAGIHDRPDRTARMRVAAGNSVYTARWGWSADLYSVQEILPPCDYCHSRLLSNLPIPSFCKNGCAAFDFSRLTFPTPKDFPEEFRPPTPVGDRMPCKKILIADMKKAMSIAYKKVVVDGWRKPTLSAFLRPEGIQPDISTKFSLTPTVSVLYNERRTDRHVNDARLKRVNTPSYTVQCLLPHFGILTTLMSMTSSMP